MEHVCTIARFSFWNGQTQYTVEFAYGISSWYVFEDNKTTDAVFSKKIEPRKSKTPNRDEAAFILDEYLQTVIN